MTFVTEESSDVFSTALHPNTTLTTSTPTLQVSQRHRVVITGCGVVSPLGNSSTALANALRRGLSGVRSDNCSTELTPYAVARCIDLAPEWTTTEFSLLDPVVRFTLHAAKEALDQSALLLDPDRLLATGVYFGTATAGAHSIDQALDAYYFDDREPRRDAIIQSMPNAPAALLSIRHGLQGPMLTFADGCAASSTAIGEAFRAIQSGRSTRILAGGAEAPLAPSMMKMWGAMRILATPDATAPHTTCRPFARTRNGMVIGEGAAMLMLESYDAASERGAPILAEIIGYGRSTDACHISIPSPAGQRSAMLDALNDANLRPSEIDYLNAHGTATRTGDRSETRAIKAAFGDAARSLPVSSTKSTHGNLLGAAGALEAAVCLAALEHNFIPPTMHLHDVDPDCDLDYVANGARSGPGVHITTCMSNSFSFGGNNAVLIFRKL